MRSPVAFAAALSLTALLAACGAPSAPTSAAPAQAAVPDLLVSAQEFGRLAHVRPSDVAYLIDGDSATVYQLQYASTLSGAAVGGGNVTVQSLKPVTQVVHTSQEVFAPLQAQAATCGGSDGPYYKSVFQGAVGFRHDMILPPSTSVPRSGSAAFLYGGYAASTTNVEIGFQRLSTDTTWQMYMAMRVPNASARQDAPDTNGTWRSDGWRFNNVRAAGGATVNFNSRSEIGTDGLHYLITDVVSGASTYKVGYRSGSGSTLDISALRPSNVANIEVRKVASFAGGQSISVNSYMNLAKFRTSQYRTSGGSLLTWPNTSTSRCKTSYALTGTGNTGTLYTKYDPNEVSGSDTVSINNNGSTTLP